ETPGIDQVNWRRMLSKIVVAADSFLMMLVSISHFLLDRKAKICAVLCGHAVQDRVVTGQPDEGRIEVVQVFFQDFWRIALTIDADKHKSDSIGLRPQGCFHLREIGQGRRADIRAVGVAEDQDDSAPAQIPQIQLCTSLAREREVMYPKGRF